MGSTITQKHWEEPTYTLYDYSTFFLYLQLFLYLENTIKLTTSPHNFTLHTEIVTLADLNLLFKTYFLSNNKDILEQKLKISMLYDMFVSNKKNLITLTVELLQHSLSQTKRQELHFGCMLFLGYYV